MFLWATFRVVKPWILDQMLISRQRHFIFLHTPKTAGTSLSLSLARNMAPDDIMIGGWADAYRNHIPYNQFARKIAKQNTFGYAYSCLKNLIKRKDLNPKPGFVNRQIKAYFRDRYNFFADAHTPASVVQKFDPELWNSAYKFAFVRNPWTHAVSSYKWNTRRVGSEHPVSFREFLLRVAEESRPDPENVRPEILSNWQVYTINDRIAVNFVGRYERLCVDLQTISKKIGFNVSVHQLVAKGNIRNRQKPISDYYDEECVELVRRIYKKEIETFSYTVPF